MERTFPFGVFRYKGDKFDLDFLDHLKKITFVVGSFADEKMKKTTLTSTKKSILRCPKCTAGITPSVRVCYCGVVLKS
jgi:hypothetical protein